MMKDWEKRCLNAGIFWVCAGQDNFRMLISLCFNSLSCLCVTSLLLKQYVFYWIAKKKQWANRIEEALDIGDCPLWERLRCKYMMSGTASQTFVVTPGTTIKRTVIVLLFLSPCCWEKCFCSSVVNWMIKLVWIGTVLPLPSSFG